MKKPKSAKKADAPEKTAAQPDRVKSSPVISEAMLKKLLKADDGIKQEIDGLTGNLREQIGNAKEKHHLDPAAYALLKKFHRIKSVEKKAALYDTFVAYMYMSGEMKLIESVAELPLEEVEDEDDDGGDVVRPQFGGHQRMPSDVAAE